MRLLLVGAFTYPHDQGSQIYFQEQAIALRAAGAEVHLLSYGSATTRSPDPNPVDPDRWRALDGFPHTTLPAWAAPSSGRSGPQLGKLSADLCLGLALRQTLRRGGLERASSEVTLGASIFALSRASSSASSRLDAPATTRFLSRLHREAPRFDAILAHHAEAALLAFHALPRSHPPILYCAHTLLEQELPKYFSPLPFHDLLETRTANEKADEAAGGADSTSLRQRALAGIGRVIDRSIARQADGWIALTQSATRVMNAASEQPGRRIAPPVADPELDPERLDPDAVARVHGLVPGAYFLYSGNLDPYQDLPLLAGVARERREGRGARRGHDRPPTGCLPIVLATHDEEHRRQFWSLGISIVALVLSVAAIIAQVVTAK